MASNARTGPLRVAQSHGPLNGAEPESDREQTM